MKVLNDKKHFALRKIAKKRHRKNSKILFAILPLKKVLAVFIGLFISVVLCISFFSIDRVITASVGERLIPIYSVEREDKVVAISFDCAWGVDYTDKLLSIMEEEQVKCTFFCVEFWTEKYKEYVKKISDYGHEIGTHSATHPHMTKLTESAINSELNSSKKAIEDITGKKVELFRAPFGEYDNKVISSAELNGLFTIQWDVDSLDWKDLSAKEICDRVINRVKSGSIVLFHNQGLHTAEALPTIISQLKSKGYEFVSIGELIYRNNYQMRTDGTQVQNS